MPCYTRIQTTIPVEWDVKRTNVNLLARALEDLGFVVQVFTDQSLSAAHPKHGTFSYASGSAQQTTTYSQERLDPAALKQAYNKRVVHTQARKMGWRCPQPGTPQWQSNNWSVQK